MNGDLHNLVDALWVLFCASLVFFMQPGFSALEAGLTRSKSSINVAMKNLADAILAILFYWLIGYGLMYGPSVSGLIGFGSWTPSLQDQSPLLSAQLLFQTMFCATAVTLTAGAVAERMRFQAFIIISLIVCITVYPVIGHWSWNDQGWLKQLGFYDFGGATVVHSVGGWAALAAVIIVGPRLGRFDESGKAQKINSSNLSLSVVGCLILWIGWLGFNGGSE